MAAHLLLSYHLDETLVALHVFVDPILVAGGALVGAGHEASSPLSSLKAGVLEDAARAPVPVCGPLNPETSCRGRPSRSPVPGEAGDEVLLVVDEDDEPVDEAPRSRVHEQALCHRAVHVLLSDEEGGLWLQKRSEEKATYPSRWTSSASGHVPAGESLRGAAEREVEEELGVRAPLLAFVGRLYVEDLDEGEREFTYVFAGVHPGGFDPDEGEVAGVSVFDPHEIEERLQVAPGAFADTFRQLWREARADGLETDEGSLEV